jgi:hypothetical protein
MKTRLVDWPELSRNAIPSCQSKALAPPHRLHRKSGRFHWQERQSFLIASSRGLAHRPRVTAYFHVGNPSIASDLAFPIRLSGPRTTSIYPRPEDVEGRDQSAAIRGSDNSRRRLRNAHSRLCPPPVHQQSRRGLYPQLHQGERDRQTVH